MSRKTRDRWDIMINYGRGLEREYSEFTVRSAVRTAEGYAMNTGAQNMIVHHRERKE